jgi:hypothetical protein
MVDVFRFGKYEHARREERTCSVDFVLARGRPSDDEQRSQPGWIGTRKGVEVQVFSTAQISERYEGGGRPGGSTAGPGGGG